MRLCMLALLLLSAAAPAGSSAAAGADAASLSAAAAAAPGGASATAAASCALPRHPWPLLFWRCGGPLPPLAPACRPWPLFSHHPGSGRWQVITSHKWTAPWPSTVLTLLSCSACCCAAGTGTGLGGLPLPLGGVLTLLSRPAAASGTATRHSSAGVVSAVRTGTPQGLSLPPLTRHAPAACCGCISGAWSCSSDTRSSAASCWWPSDCHASAALSSAERRASLRNAGKNLAPVCCVHVFCVLMCGRSHCSQMQPLAPSLAGQCQHRARDEHKPCPPLTHTHTLRKCRGQAHRTHRRTPATLSSASRGTANAVSGVAGSMGAFGITNAPTAAWCAPCFPLAFSASTTLK
jgi:hypothetical protein